MTEEQRTLLELITKELNGKMTEWIYSDPNITKRKIVIEYDVKSKR